MRSTLAPIAALATLAVLPTGCWKSCDFDRAEWRAAMRHPDATASRHEAIESQLELLVECEALKGKTYREVRALLGDPTEGLKHRRPTSYRYDVGTPENLSDYPGLEIHFEDGRVRRAFVDGYVEP